MNIGDAITGYVEAMGSNVTEFKVGDRVGAFHEMTTQHSLFAEYAIAVEKFTFHLAKQTSFEEAATIPLAAMTAASELFCSLGLPEPWAMRGARFRSQTAQEGTGTPVISVAGRGISFVESLLDKSKGDIVIAYRTGNRKVFEGIQSAIPNSSKLLYAFDAVSDGTSPQNLAQVLDPHGNVTFVVPGAFQEMPPTVKKSVTLVWAVHGNPIAGSAEDLSDFGKSSPAFSNRLKHANMSTTTTSLVPSPLSSSYNTALQTTQKAASQASHAVTAATSQVSQQAQSLGLTTPKPAAVSTPTSTPGKFRHPSTTEILRRNASSTITERRVKGALTNAAALLASFIFSDVYYSSVTPLLSKTGLLDGSQVSSTVLLLLRLLFCINIALLLRPLLPYAPSRDEVDDIPLTPSQRQLLGLAPSTKSPPASGEVSASYITPPRYRRVSNSQYSGESNNGSPHASTGRRSISANYSSSPLSTSRFTHGSSPTPSQSITSRRTNSGSPRASPLFHRAIKNQSQSQISDIDYNASAFSSFGASTGTSANTGFGGGSLSRSQSMRERQRPGRDSQEPMSPSPTRGPQLVPGLNYKWLYDKGRKLPKSESSYGF
ncbi:hypothetical protein A1O7_04911 [Cladophialophora yegresii CBS 114405]|uniref:Enoyl reductase (ER) domain-containing protein n=1 Tax=Cladophialophora yegresii CBS 114405 TaxID=1182544 RepID=W9VYJ2_9EURO|nr:uncharacterized protein A1O7_04911 [Cladophialophora yegresii CBS 114405]EXJ60758.1 hypothetical protein A1O7_04911 [Cladophialophora yegresii CBS 114405]